MRPSLFAEAGNRKRVVLKFETPLCVLCVLCISVVNFTPQYSPQRHRDDSGLHGEN